MSSIRPSNDVSGILNLITLFVSIPIFAVGLLLSKNAVTECERLLDKPLILVGLFLILLSLTAFIGTCCRVPGLLWIYLVFMFLFILGGVVFTAFAFVVTNEGAGRSLPGKGYKEYRLGDYSIWLQRIVNNAENWNKVKTCLVQSRICTDFHSKFHSDSLQKFHHEPLNALQSGCCKPSNDCGFTYKNPTNWTKEHGIYKNPDCKKWDNNPKVLCFNCQSCKAGILDNVKNSWKKHKVAHINVIFLIFLIIVYSCAYCAFRDSMREDHADYHRGLKP
ncbi:tetraspanin-7-like [Herrania umbratica]|uniref:Tetraspanin-7-like n=1 Tax=Herrania umbratica TaxID=108875 RepID=A0A6J1A2F8_9ROSI|nr:tetraspanin-7-like [Herrania umbratica]